MDTETYRLRGYGLVWFKTQSTVIAESLPADISNIDLSVQLYRRPYFHYIVHTGLISLFVIISFVIRPNLLHLFLEWVKCEFKSRTRVSNLELC